MTGTPGLPLSVAAPCACARVSTGLSAAQRSGLAVSLRTSQCTTIQYARAHIYTYPPVRSYAGRSAERTSTFPCRTARATFACAHGDVRRASAGSQLARGLSERSSHSAHCGAGRSRLATQPRRVCGHIQPTAAIWRANVGSVWRRGRSSPPTAMMLQLVRRFRGRGVERRTRRTLITASLYSADVPERWATSSAVSLPCACLPDRAHTVCHTQRRLGVAAPVVIHCAEVGAGEDESGSSVRAACFDRLHQRRFPAHSRLTALTGTGARPVAF